MTRVLSAINEGLGSYCVYHQLNVDTEKRGRSSGKFSF